MAEQPNISQILAALAAQRPGGTPMQGQPPPPPQQQQQQQPLQGYPGGYPAPSSSAATPAYHIPPPSNSGSLDLSNIKPVNSGSVSFNDAVAKARGIAAERGVSYDIGRANGTPNRDGDPRLAGRTYRRSRSRSRSPPRVARDSFRDNYNPYRDERRDDPRRTNVVGYPSRERSFSPGMRTGRGPGPNFSPPPGRGFGGPSERSPPGRRSADDNVETIVIDSGLVGLIIGRQGENLRRVEAETATRVQFMTGPEASGPMRQCKITGTRIAREDAKTEIYRIIEENGKMLSSKAAVPDRFTAGASKGISAHQLALRAGEDATQIMVPNRTVGLIIGRGGETIRDLQERSQCHVNIVGEEKSVNGLRPVNLIGTPQAATMAKDLIMEIVESDTKSLANQGGGPRDTGRGPPGFGGFAGGDGFGSDKVNDTIVVPSEAVGMIIGKGGETIKDMQSTTSCKINVAPASGQDFEREIGLVGTRGAIDQAKRAIMDKVHAVEEKNRGGGGPRRDEQFNDQYSHTQQPYGQQNQNQVQIQNQQQPQGQAQAGGDVDPYAAYGGYQNYVALWYSSLAQQGQQPMQGQGPPGEQRPPGS